MNVRSSSYNIIPQCSLPVPNSVVVVFFIYILHNSSTSTKGYKKIQPSTIGPIGNPWDLCSSFKKFSLKKFIKID